MADFVVTIKVKLEGLEGRAAESGGGGAVPSSGGGGGAAPSLGLEELRKEFAGLSALVRVVSQTLFNLGKNARDASRNIVSGGGQPSQQSQQSRPAGEPASTSSRPGGGASDAPRTKASDASPENAAEAFIKGLINAVGSATEQLKDSGRGVADAIGVLTDEVLDGAKDAIKRLGSIDVRSAEKKGSPRTIPSPNDPQAFLELAVKPALAEASIQEQRRLLTSTVKDLFKVTEGIGGEAKTEADKLGKIVSNIIDNAIADVDRDLGGQQFFRKLLQKLKGEFKSFEERVGSKDILTPTAKKIPELAVQRLASREFTNLGEVAFKALKDLQAAIDKGADEIEVTRLRRKLEATALAIENFTKGERGVGGRPSVFEPTGPRGEKLSSGIAAPRLLEAVPAAPGRAIQELNKLQKRALDSLVTAAKRLEDPAESTRKAFDILGEELESIPDNLRLLKDAFIEIGRGAFETTDQFLRFKEATGLLKGGRGPGGAATDPKVTSPQLSLRLLESQISKGRERVSGRQGQEETLRGLTFTDSAGNIRKIDVSLKQLGKTLNDVRVRAIAASDNMFDRSSVRTALQRVATWGAAAGIVFGAVNAFRNAVTIVVDTESQIVSLAKVMDESRTNFDEFATSARNAALAVAQDFGQPLNDVLETMILFGQQGRNLAESVELAGSAAAAAVVTTLDQPTAASALTATIEQFGFATTEAARIVDSFNEVSNNAAVTETVLAQAIEKAGLAANNAGVSFDELNGIIAAISEQTRQSGNEIGTALRFIFSRLTTDEADEGLRKVGISARDAQGNLRNFTDIVTELRGKFDDLTKAQQTNVAIAVSGTRRFNTFLALLNNFERFTESAANSVNSLGSAQRELERVTETAAFKIQQLKNAAAETALEFGDVFVGALKTSTDVLKAFLGALNGLPDVVKGGAVALGIGSIAFIKFADQVTDFLELTSGGNVFKGIFGGFKTGLTTGITSGQQAGEGTIEKLVESFGTGGFGIIAARSVSDFGNKASEAGTNFAGALKAAGKELRDVNGNVVKVGSNFGKFSAVARNFRVGEIDGLSGVTNSAALGLASMNTNTGRLIGFFGRLRETILKFSAVNLIIGRLDKSILATGSSAQILALELGKFVLAAAVIFAVVKVAGLLKDVLFETGAEQAKQFDEEIARRQESINQLNNQIASTKNLADERDRLAAAVPEDSALTRERIAQRTFRSPELQQVELREQEQQVANAIGIVSPQTIADIDDLGNITLRSAAAFNTLAGSAVSAEKALLSLVQIKAIEKIASDLQPAEGFKKAFGSVVRFLTEGFTDAFEDAGQTVIDVFDEERKKFLAGLEGPANQAAVGIAIELRVLDGGAAERLDQISRGFTDSVAKVKVVLTDIETRIARLPSDTPEAAFQVLSSSIRPILERSGKEESRRTGQSITIQQQLNRFFLQNRDAIRQANAQALIEISPELTLGRFNEQGIVQEVIKTRENIVERLSTAEGGTIVLFNDDDISSGLTQGLLRVLSDGRRQIEFIGDEFGKVFVRSIQQIADKVSEVQLLNPRAFADQISVSLAEAGRLVAGAGRGALIAKDLDIGAGFRSELTAQQRVSERDPTTAFRLIRAQQEQQRAVKEFASPQRQREQADTGQINLEFINKIRDLNIEFDKVATVLRFKTAIEEVVISFEKASQEIIEAINADGIRAEFAGALSGLPNVVPAQFKLSTPGSLSGEERLSQLSPGLVTLANSIAATRKAAGEFEVGITQARRNIPRFLSEFVAAQGPGGARSPQRTTDLLNAVRELTGEGIGDADALQAALTKEQLSEAETQTGKLEEIRAILAKGGSAEDRGAEIAQAAVRAAQLPLGDARTSAFRDVAKATGGLSSEAISQISASDLSRILTVVPRDRQTAEFRDAASTKIAQDRVSAATTGLFRFAGELTDLQVIIAKFRAASGLPDPAARPPALSTGVGLTLSQKALKTAIDAIPGGINGLAEGNISDDVIDRFSKDIAVAFRAEGEKASPRNRGITITSSPGGSLGGGVVNEIRGFGESNTIGSPPTGAELPTEVQAANISRALINKADIIEQELASASEDLRERSRNILLGLSDTLAPVLPIKDAPAIDAKKDAALREREAEILSTLNRQLDSQTVGLERSAANLLQFSLAITGASQALRQNLEAALTEIGVGQRLAPFRTSATGALRGVESSSANLGLDPRASLSKFTAEQLSAIASPALIRSLNIAQSASDGLVRVLEDLATKEQEVLRLREAALRSGDSEAVALANLALRGLGSAATRVEGQLREARNTLGTFGDSLTDLQAISQLRIDVSSIVDSFTRQLALEFDRTSIESALGKTPFSITRPTFEQFQQGQDGDLTQFQRAIQSADFLQSTGQISATDAKVARQRAGFDRDEGVIAFAQQGENRKLQAAVQSAEQIQGKLFDFASRGGPGGGIAGSLLSQIKRELESAGDIIPGQGIGSRSIRDPNTGRQVRIPASDIKQFRGIPSLDGIQDELARLEEQFRQQDISERAEAIFLPIVEAINVIPEKLDEQIAVLRKSVGGEDAIAIQQQQLKTLLDVQKSLVNISDVLAKGSLGQPLDSAQRGRLQQFNDVISEIPGGQAVLDSLEVKNFLISIAALAVAGDTAKAGIEAAAIAGEALAEGGSTFETLVTNAGDVSTSMVTFNDTLGPAAAGIKKLGAQVNLLNIAIGKLSILSGAQPQEKFADGGLISGPGGPRDDRVPIMASPGEFVINARSAGRIGLSRLNALNSGVRRFQDGGLITDEEKERLKSLEARGVRFGGVGEPLVVSDNDSLVQRILGREAGLDREGVAARLTEGKRVEAIRNDEGRKLGTFGRFEKGKIFVRRSEDGKRLSFAGSSNQGGIDISEFQGVSAQDPDAIFKEANNRKQAEKQIKDASAKRRKQREAEFLTLKGKEAEQLAAGRKTADFSQAFNQLQGDLQRRTVNFIPPTEESLRDIINARQILADPARVDSFGDEEFDILRRQINTASPRISIASGKLEDSISLPLVLPFPPDFDDRDTGLLLRRNPQRSNISFNRDALTGQVSPEIFGNAFLSSDRLDNVFLALQNEGFSPKSLEALSGAAEDSGSRAGFLLRSKNNRLEEFKGVGDFIQEKSVAAANFVDLPILSDLIIRTGSSLAVATDFAAGIALSPADLAFNPGAVVEGLIDLPGAAVNAVGNIITTTGDENDLSRDLRSADTKNDRARIRRQIAGKQRERGAEVLTVASAALLGVPLVKGGVSAGSAAVRGAKNVSIKGIGERLSSAKSSISSVIEGGKTRFSSARQKFRDAREAKAQVRLDKEAAAKIKTEAASSLREAAERAASGRGPASRGTGGIDLGAAGATPSPLQLGPGSRAGQRLLGDGGRAGQRRLGPAPEPRRLRDPSLPERRIGPIAPSRPPAPGTGTTANTANRSIRERISGKVKELRLRLEFIRAFKRVKGGAAGTAPLNIENALQLRGRSKSRARGDTKGKSDFEADIAKARAEKVVDSLIEESLVEARLAEQLAKRRAFNKRIERSRSDAAEAARVRDQRLLEESRDRAVVSGEIGGNTSRIAGRTVGPSPGSVPAVKLPSPLTEAQRASAEFIQGRARQGELFSSKLDTRLNQLPPEIRGRIEAQVLGQGKGVGNRRIIPETGSPVIQLSDNLQLINDISRSTGISAVEVARILEGVPLRKGLSLADPAVVRSIGSEVQRRAIVRGRPQLELPLEVGPQPFPLSAKSAIPRRPGLANRIARTPEAAALAAKARAAGIKNPARIQGPDGKFVALEKANELGILDKNIVSRQFNLFGEEGVVSGEIKGASVPKIRGKTETPPILFEKKVCPRAGSTGRIRSKEKSVRRCSSPC